MATLERAIQIAAIAHQGQVDKAGEPYILHPLRVMLRVTGEAARIAAVLHDVVEDSEITLANLAAEGFDQTVLDAVAALTKHPGESRLAAARRAAQNPLARMVKLADNAENMDISRIANPTEQDWARLEEYKTVRQVLLEACYPINRYEHYHAHVYFSADTVAQAKHLWHEAQQLMVPVGKFHESCVGPHPAWSFQISFDREQFESVVNWLDTHRQGLTVLVHGVTGNDLADHTDHAAWLGEPQALVLRVFQ